MSVVWPFAFTADRLPTRLGTFDESVTTDASLSTLGHFLVLTDRLPTTFRKGVASVQTLLETSAVFVRLFGRCIHANFQIRQSRHRHVAVRHSLVPHFLKALAQKTWTDCLLYGHGSRHLPKEFPTPTARSDPILVLSWLSPSTRVRKQGYRLFRFHREEASSERS